MTPQELDRLEQAHVRLNNVCRACCQSWPCDASELVAAARLGAAWQEAEAALPEGWVTGLIGIAHGTGRWYTASAYVDLTDYADDHDAESAQADSPAAALLALAEALRRRP